MFANTVYRALEYIIDFLFFLDIVINFRTTYNHSQTGDEVFDPKLIAIHYIKGRFWIDIAAVIPFDQFVTNVDG